RGQRLLQPAGAKRGARCRSKRDLRGVAGGHLPGNPPSRRPGRELALQHVSFPGIATGANRQSGKKLLGSGSAPREHGILLLCQRRQWPPPLRPEPRRAQSQRGRLSPLTRPAVATHVEIPPSPVGVSLCPLWLQFVGLHPCTPPCFITNHIV